MRRASITIPDGLESALERYRGDLEAPPSLASVVQAALERYLEERGYPVENGLVLEEEEEISLPSGPKPRGFAGWRCTEAQGRTDDVGDGDRRPQVTGSALATALYLDTSALVKLYLAEAESKTVHRAVEKADRSATSTVAYAELRAAFGRRHRAGDLDDEGLQRAVARIDADWRGYLRLSATNLLAYRAGEMAERYALRGFDAIHLASAARLQERFPDLRFLAFDDRLVAAAREAFVPVYGGT